MSPVFSNSRRLQVITPSKASYKDLAVYHSRDYLDTVLDPSPSANRASNVTEFGLEDVSADIVDSLLVTLLVSGE
jgi:histone deacetylase 8